MPIKEAKQHNQFISDYNNNYCYQNSLGVGSVGRMWVKAVLHDGACLFQLESRLWPILGQVRQLFSIHSTTTLAATTQQVHITYPNFQNLTALQTATLLLRHSPFLVYITIK